MVRETQGKDAFIDALVNSDMRVRIKQSRPKIQNYAIRLSVELDAYFKTKKRGDLRMIESDERAQPRTTKLLDLMKAMQIKLDKLEKQVQNRPRQR